MKTGIVLDPHKDFWPFVFRIGTDLTKAQETWYTAQDLSENTWTYNKWVILPSAFGGKDGPVYLRSYNGDTLLFSMHAYEIHTKGGLILRGHPDILNFLNHQ